MKSFVIENMLRDENEKDSVCVVWLGLIHKLWLYQ